MEIDVERLLAVGEQPRSAPRISAYPPATVDVALVVGEDVPVASVEAALRSGGADSTPRKWAGYFLLSRI